MPPTTAARCTTISGLASANEATRTGPGIRRHPSRLRLGSPSLGLIPRIDPAFGGHVAVDLRHVSREALPREPARVLAPALAPGVPLKRRIAPLLQEHRDFPAPRFDVADLAVLDRRAADLA